MTAIAEQECQQVETRKARIAAKAERIADLAAERLTDHLQSREKIPASALVPIFGVAVDKLAILSGEPALTINYHHTHSHQHELAAALNAAVARIEQRAKGKVIDASVAGENAAQKEG